MDNAIREQYENLGAGRLTRDIVLPPPRLAISYNLTNLSFNNQGSTSFKKRFINIKKSSLRKYFMKIVDS